MNNSFGWRFNKRFATTIGLNKVKRMTYLHIAIETQRNMKGFSFANKRSYLGYPYVLIDHPNLLNHLKAKYIKRTFSFMRRTIDIAVEWILEFHAKDYG